MRAPTLHERVSVTPVLCSLYEARKPSNQHDGVHSIFYPADLQLCPTGVIWGRQKDEVDYKQGEGPQRAQRVKALATKPEDLTSTPGMAGWKERTDSCKLSSELH
ncbi:hypothetical protein STEG23_006931, partial [Scotinomys teguina]